MKSVKRGEVYLADLNPTMGSEQAGFRPVLILQSDILNRLLPTVITIPLTTNLARSSLPFCLKIPKGEGGLDNDSVILCHQIRVLDQTRLIKKLGMVNPETLVSAESRVLFALGIL